MFHVHIVSFSINRKLMVKVRLIISIPLTIIGRITTWEMSNNKMTSNSLQILSYSISNSTMCTSTGNTYCSIVWYGTGKEY